jgi:hypothetical protein
MPSSFVERWLRGFGLTIRALLLFGIAWGIPRGVGELLARSEMPPEWLRTLVLLVWMVLMLVFCPVVFEWLARKGLLTSEISPRAPTGDHRSAQ